MNRQTHTFIVDCAECMNLILNTKDQTRKEFLEHMYKRKESGDSGRSQRIKNKTKTKRSKVYNG